MSKWDNTNDTQYPASMIDGGELLGFLRARNRMDSTREDDLQALANFVLRRAFDEGQVVAREEFNRAISERDQRDIEVIKATGRFINEHFLTDPKLSWQKISVNFHDFHFFKIAEMLKEPK